MGYSYYIFVFGTITLYDAIPTSYQKVPYVISFLFVLVLLIYIIGIKYNKKEID